MCVRIWMPFYFLIVLSFLKLPVLLLCFDTCLRLSISLWPSHTHFPLDVLLFCASDTKEAESKTSPTGGRQLWGCPESSECGGSCSMGTGHGFSMGFRDPCSMGTTAACLSHLHQPALHRLPQKLAFMPERQLQVAREKALIKNCSCPFHSSGVFSSLLYQLLPVNVSFSVFV